MKLLQSILTGMLVVSTLHSHSQTTFIVSAGISPALYATGDDYYDDNSSSDLKVGFYAGATAHIVMNPHFSFEPGLSFVQKGGIEKNDGGGYIKSTLNLNYIELPMDFVYTRKNKFFVGAGPSISWAVSGKVKVDDGSNTEKTAIKFGSDDSELKRFDAGIELMAGFRFKSGVCISTNLNSSFLNLSNINGVLFMNGYWGFRIGYVFGNKGN